jgi:hypothetical protein
MANRGTKCGTPFAADARSMAFVGTAKCDLELDDHLVHGSTLWHRGTLGSGETIR